MELTCPNCAAQFSVPAGAIGPKGRKVKCSQCEHVWRQMPAGIGAAEPEALVRPQAAKPRSPQPEPSWSAAEPPPPGAVPLEMEPRGSRPASEPVDEFPSFDSDDLFDSPKREDDGLDEFDFGGDDDTALGSSFDDLIGDDSLAGGGGQDSDIDRLLSSDADPIPEMFGGDEEKPGRRGGGAAKALATVLTLLLVLGGIAVILGGIGYFLRNEIVRAFPVTEPIYAMAGVPVNALGLGLRFEKVASERIARDGVDTLVVRGFIENTSERARELPYLHLGLYDATDALVQNMVAEPPEQTLEPGGTVGFRIQMENPSAAARKYEIDWTEAPGAGQ